MFKAIETTGFVNAQHQLVLNEQLPITSSHVRVIVMVMEEEPTSEKFQATQRNYVPDTIVLDKKLKQIKLLSMSESSGLCGVWEDEKTAEELIEDIMVGRTLGRTHEILD